MKPKLLLHCCCAPCVTHPIRILSETFEVTAFFYNPNIYPESEYQARLLEIQKLSQNWQFPLLIGPYEFERWEARIRGHENDPEGGSRCLLCYQLRLEETALKAKFANMDYFTSTLSISPHKNANQINAIGEAIASRYGISFYAANFKKKDGFKISCELSKQEGLYRQNYCGCQYSRRELNDQRISLWKNRDR